MRRFGVRIRIEPVEIGFPKGMRDERHVVKFFFDSRGALWIMVISGLYRRWPDGRTERYGEENGFPGAFVQSMFEDRRGLLWVGNRRHGLHLLVAEPRPGTRIVEMTLSIDDGLPGEDVRNITSMSDGRIWICTVGGLSLFKPEAPGAAKFTNYTAAHGLASEEVYNIAEDMEGNLWVGTRNAGVMRIAGSGFVTYGPRDGFEPGQFNTIRESSDGRIVIYNGSSYDKRYFNYFNGRKFVRVNHRITSGFGYSREQAILQDREGDWWIATDRGVYRYSGLSSLAGFETARPKAIYDQKIGLARNYVDRIFEDRRGDIWIVTGVDPKSLVYLHRW